MGVLSNIIGSVLGMDLINVEVTPDEVIYTYRTDGIIDSVRIEKLKAIIMSVLNLPADIPSKVEVEKAKQGVIMKGFVIRVTVPKKGANIGALIRRRRHEQR